MLRTILLVLAALVIAFVAYVAVKPAHYTVARSAVIPAAPEAIFPHINNLKNWDAWSPWAKKDPNATISFDGPDDGVGASFTWDGNAEVGKGKMTIVESRANERVGMKLEFMEPMTADADSAMELVPEGGGTKVIWTLSGRHSFFDRAMCTLMGVDVDSAVGPEYEKGLANLTAVVAAAAAGADP